MGTRINETLARLRSESGLTQEEAANHLGITKAAVSKWECGQSMPDISLLPAIADLYSTSIDDLFGRVQEPDKESINAAYQTALALLGEDYDAGLDYVRQQVRENWTCCDLLRMMGAALFAQIPKLRGFNGGLLEDESLQCADEAERIIRRVIDLSPSGAGISVELPSLIRILLWTGREREAEKLLDGYERKEPNLQAALLAQLHREAGRNEEALAVLQRALLVSLLEAQSAMAAMVPMVDDSRLAELTDLAAALQPDKTFASIFPTLMPAIRLQQAKNLVRTTPTDAVFRALDAFADALDEACDAMSNPVNPSIFDKVEDMLWDDADDEVTCARSKGVAELRAAYVSTLENDRLWDSLRDDVRFCQVIARISDSPKARR
ncbi:helix-turn-helix domain-containing protein [Adlercreutzia equolifaciens]|uniref:helix-turn-helix domain-containing protein n=1 Tax=Adlercreutzia equolifaciens TaxID=446660 RepID=UPI00351FC297